MRPISKIFFNFEAPIDSSVIPSFPEFKGVGLKDHEEVCSFVNEFHPYSDFNYTNLWSWDIKGKIRLSELNNNLVILFDGYLSLPPFFSFIGLNKVKETADELIVYLKEYYGTLTLRLIPKEVAIALAWHGFTVIQDENSHDYVYVAYKLAEINMLNPNRFQAGRDLRAFLKKCSDYKITIQEKSEICKAKYIELFQRWAINKKLDSYSLLEYKAFSRYCEIENTQHFVSVFINEYLVGFVAYEVVTDIYAICHFIKADINYKGAYAVLMMELGKALKKEHIQYLNFQEDLGLPGLRRSKQKFHPLFYLHKYSVEAPFNL